VPSLAARTPTPFARSCLMVPVILAMSSLSCQKRSRATQRKDSEAPAVTLFDQD